LNPRAEVKVFLIGDFIRQIIFYLEGHFQSEKWHGCKLRVMSYLLAEWQKMSLMAHCSIIYL